MPQFLEWLARDQEESDSFLASLNYKFVAAIKKHQ
jgi:hypothetical protein